MAGKAREGGLTVKETEAVLGDAGIEFRDVIAGLKTIRETTGVNLLDDDGETVLV